MAVHPIMFTFNDAFQVEGEAGTLGQSTKRQFRLIKEGKGTRADAAVVADEWVKRIERYRDIAASIRDELATAAGD